MPNETTKKKPYASPYRSLAAIWSVLAAHSSPEKPMSIQDIVQKLGDREDAPSPTTLKRLLPDELETLCTLFPGLEAHVEGAGLRDAYLSEGKLRVVVENRSGETLASGEMLALLAPGEGISPSYSTVDSLLKMMSDCAESAAEDSPLPVRLKCVVARSKNGKTVYLPYGEEQDKWEAEDAAQVRTNNRARRYYLESVLTGAQWRILTDMIKVYPYISENQTRQMLHAIKKVFPGCSVGGSRYSFKKGNDRLFANLEVLDLAIRKRQRVSITYGEYVLSPQGKPVLQKRKNAGQFAAFEPYALMWSNGYYYLVGKDRGMMNLRVDRILKAIMLNTREDHFELPPDFDPVSYRDRSPVMYPGTPELIRLRCPAFMVSVVMDFFGEQARFRSVDADTVEVTLSVARAGARLFVMQYADRVEVLEPASLRDEVKRRLAEALDKYK